MLPTDGDGTVPPLLPLPQVPDVVFPGLAPVLRDLLLPAVLAEAAELPPSPTHPGRLRAQQLGCFLRLVLSLPSARSHGAHPKPSERWPGLSGSRAVAVPACPYVPKVPSRLGHADTRGVWGLLLDIRALGSPTYSGVRQPFPTHDLNFSPRQDHTGLLEPPQQAAGLADAHWGLSGGCLGGCYSSQ